MLLEFVGGAAPSVQGIEEDVNLGESTYQATVTVHFDPEEDHFWISVKDETGCWWRIDDFCGSEDLWRRQYLRQKDILVTERHRLDAKDHLPDLISEGLHKADKNKKVKVESPVNAERDETMQYFRTSNANCAAGEAVRASGTKAKLLQIEFPAAAKWRLPSDGFASPVR